ncbi:DUF6153 family protein [Streptomyces sp. NPDC015346]|uniref:DUF6153 family protein n=1 Tax=Streptomyces sp. NPDC015346 TaxID=3364954 RepID=UPI003701F3BF
MTSTTQPSSRRPAGRGFVLLVLAVLAGVLAMHGLGPGPAPAKAAATATAKVQATAAAGGHVMATATATATAAAGGHVMATAHEEAAPQRTGDCSHTDGGTGHADHADTTCAAAGVGAPYAPPVPAAALDAGPVPVAPSGGAAGAPESGRAPPDLAELQLLRI